MSSRMTSLLLAFLASLIPVLGSAAEDRPRNIILMISDGCGFGHVVAADHWQYGELGSQVYEGFELACAMATVPLGRTYDPTAFWAGERVTEHPTDSAAAITAMTCGVKTRNGKLGITPDGVAHPTLVERMERSGRMTGVVSSVTFPHATPGGTVVRNEKRSHYEEIARAMIHDSAIDVIMGPGHPDYDQQGDVAKRPRYKLVGGKDTWAAILSGTAGGDADGDGDPDPWVLVQDRAGFQALATGPTPARVLGVPRIRETLQQQRSGDRKAAPGAVPKLTQVPTLEEMTRAALNVLDDHEGGFFLLVEGGAVDWAAHDNEFGRMIEEQVDFNRTVEAVTTWVAAHGGWQETLVIVTADHETGYLTGPKPSGESWQDCRFRHPLVGHGAGHLPEYAWNSGKHTNCLVPFFAQGPGSGLLRARAVGEDPFFGAYLDNTDLGQVLISLATRGAKP